MWSRRILLTLLAAATAGAQSRSKPYTGPRPPKPDVPYLLHAATLVETEAVEAKEEKRKDESVYAVDGPSSSARTPLAEPIFLFQAEKLQAEKLEIYKLTVKNGRREIVFPDSPKKRREIRPAHVVVTRLAESLYRIKANEGLDNGEYAITPAGSNQVFLFQVY